MDDTDLDLLLHTLANCDSISQKREKLREAIEAHTQAAVADERYELRRLINQIETVHVSIPVSYSLDSKIIRIPARDERGVVYSVIAIPQQHVEKIFQDRAVLVHSKQSKEIAE